MSAVISDRITHHRTLFISDLHLGHFSARADYVLRFLHRNPADNYVLVGDILDIWVPKSPAWSPAHSNVINFLRKRHAEGAEITYIVGNHDPHPETAPPALRLPVKPVRESVHKAADGRQYLVIHGDGEDFALLNDPRIAKIGNAIEHGLAAFEMSVRKWLGMKNANESKTTDHLISLYNEWRTSGQTYAKSLAAQARAKGLDGVICGHFHQAELSHVEDTIYANCGDWMQSFTAIGESDDGALHLLQAQPETATRPQPKAIETAPETVSGTPQAV